MHLNQLTKILIKRLEKKGMGPEMIRGFIKSLANTILDEPHMNLLQINKRLHSLGWDGFELDYHTFQLAIACFEAQGLNSQEYKTARWLESNFTQKNDS